MNDITSTSGRSILIVDDTPANLRVLFDYLEEHHFALSVAQDGKEALQRAEYLKPDLILLDIMMPEMDGIETARQLKKNPDTCAIPIIFMTALSDGEDKVAGFAAGAVDYITKPFDVAEVLARVNTHLALRAALDALSKSNETLRNEIAVRQQAEHALNLRNRAMDSCVNAILIIDVTEPGMPVKYVNPAFEKITGYSAEESIGFASPILQGDPDDPHVEREIHAALRERREGNITLRSYRKDGSFFWNDLHLGPVRDNSGEVTNFVGIFTDITETKNYQQQLEHHAHFDILTGLANRNLLDDRLRQAMAYARRQDNMVGVLFLDLDQFKFINDSMGHNTGDRLLQSVGARLAACVRDSDTVSRLGGDEFVIIFPALKQSEDAVIAAQKVLATFSHPVTVDGRDLFVTASIGVSVYPQDGDTSDALLKNADAAMYRSKDQGRGRFQFYTPELGTQLQERVDLENGLRYAHLQKEFELHYQPKVNIKSGQVSGVEALLRWRHPTHGMISPDRFIPLAEETGLIIPIGEWVLTTACVQLKKWHMAGQREMTMSVNLSAQQFRQSDVPALVRRVLAETDLHPGYLDLELTESVLMQDTESVIAALRELKDIGVTISLDDFGTGYSSLSYLKRFPIDVVKIDRSFIRSVTSNVDDATLTRAIIAIAQSLNMKTVAEGVETEAQLGFLSANHCDEMQGYFFSRAVPPEGISKLLSDGKHLPASHHGHKSGDRILLLVDDNPDDIALFSHALEGEGYRILTAAGPKEALDLLAVHRVGVVLSDARMPQMSGGEFLSRVRRLHPNVVRMLISGATELRFYTKAVNEGAIYKILIKPCEARVLREKVSEAFRRFKTNVEDESPAFSSLVTAAKERL